MSSRSLADVVVQKTTVGITDCDDEKHVAALTRNVVTSWIIDCFPRISLTDINPIDCPNLAPPAVTPISIEVGLRKLPLKLTELLLIVEGK